MAAQGTQIDEFKVDGGLGADGNGFQDTYSFQSGIYKVFVKRIWGAGNDPSVNHIIIVNTTSNNITQTIGTSTNDDTHILSGLLSAGVTEIYHLVTATKKGSFLINVEISKIASEFISILNSSSDINTLLSNLNTNYENVINTQTILINSIVTVSANNVYVKGLSVGDSGIVVGSDLGDTIIENCIGGKSCFHNDELLADISSTFIDCEGGDYSFGGDETFGGNPKTISGTFINCVGGERSFGYYGTASGTFKGCVGDSSSFGTFGTASGTFTNCVGGDGGSFGDFQFATASGTFISCQGGTASFGGGNFTIVSGLFINCIGGAGSFGGFGVGAIVSGTFTNCVGGDGSFGGTLDGKLYFCRLTSGTFQTVSGGGITRLCVDGNNTENNQG